jgi:hypothetical protein
VEQPRVCSSKAYRWYWVMLKQGVVSAGVGERPGKGVLVAWRDPEPLGARFASLSTWDRVVTYRSVRVDVCDTDMLLELPDALLESWAPGFVARSDGELEEAREAARRSGVLFHEASAAALSAQAGLTEEEAEGIRRMRAAAGGDQGGFVTGFDPTSEEERAKAAARAARFGVGASASASESAGAGAGGSDGDADMMSREKREARAKRFSVPLIEDEQVGKGLLRDLTGLRVPRKDAEEQHAKRAEALNIYGLFDHIYTRDILDWFYEFGASRVEWLHDCSANVVFADSHTAKRAVAGLSVTIPSIAGFEAAVEDLNNKGYTCAPFPMTGEQGHRFFLVRTASAGDVKAAEKEYHTNIGFDRARLGRVPGGGGFGRKMIEVIRNKAAQAAALKAEERVTGAKSKRRDSEDEDQDEGDARAKARRTADDDEVEVAAADDAE